MKPLNRIVHWCKKNLGAKRQKHARATAELCVKLCRRFGVDPGMGRIAGWGHDAMREASAEEWKAWALADGNPVMPWEEESPVLLHARAGAVFLREELALDDEEILQAVRDHTLGRPGMGPLSKILYVSDYVEPNRTHVTDRERKAILRSSLDEMTLEVLNHELEYLTSKGRTLAPPSAMLREELMRVFLSRTGAERARI